MKRRFSALLTVALLTAACNGPLGPTGPLPGASGPTVALGTALTGEGSQAFSGSWKVNTSSLPAWLRVTPLSGTGPIALQITADRSQGTPVTADEPQLSGEVQVTWTQGEQTGTTTWKVTADEYVLRGRVVDAARIEAADVGVGQGPAAALSAADTQAARGVIVKYRSASAQALALGRGLSASDLGDAGLSPTRQTLGQLGLTAGAASDLGERRVLLRAADTARALRVLRGDPNVEYAVPDAVLHAQALAAPVTPTDEYAGLQWPFQLLGYGAVWRDMEAGGYTRPVTVAVVDSGVRFDHPDLQGQLYGPGEGALDVLDFRPLGGENPYDNGDGDGPDTDPTDPGRPGAGISSHGTHVAGLIAARWGTIPQYLDCPECSTSGVVGASYRAPVKVLPIRVIDSAGNIAVTDVIHGLRYAAGLPVTLADQPFANPHPAQVINLSLGGTLTAAQAQPLCEAVTEATRAGSLVVVAAGNGYGTTPYYPAACEGAVSVGAVTLSGASAPVHARYSNSYPQVMLSAPGGVDIGRLPTFFNGGQLNGSAFPDMVFSTMWNYNTNQPAYHGESGTSQAAPQVSALAALLLSKGVTTGRDDTLARMVATATDLGAPGRDGDFGHGMINAAAALGAPAVSDTLGLRIQSARGDAYQPDVDALGRFTAYLPDGSFTVVAGRDRNANGLFGEAGEPRTERSVTLGPDHTAADLGDLTPAP